MNDHCLEYHSDEYTARGPPGLALAIAGVAVDFGCSILHKLQKAPEHAEHYSLFAKRKLEKDQCRLE